MKTDPELFRPQYVDALKSWLWNQSQRPMGTKYPELEGRVKAAVELEDAVTKALLAKQNEPAATVPAGAPLEVLAKLVDEIECPQPATTNKAPKKSPGRNSKVNDRVAAAQKYIDGMATGKYESQVDYLRQEYPAKMRRNPNSAKSWLSQFLKEPEVVKKLKVPPSI